MGEHRSKRAQAVVGDEGAAVGVTAAVTEYFVGLLGRRYQTNPQ